MLLAPQRRGLAAALSVLLVVAALVPLLGSSVGAQVAGAANPTGTCPLAPTQLTNASFEEPVLPANSYKIQSQNNVPGWSTTASTGNIEQWASVYQGVSAFAGRQFAELNADAAGALYQDLPTTPGQTLIWSLYHRARQGNDTMYVDIGIPGQPLARVATLSDNISQGWVHHTGTYVVPANQTITRFAFTSGPTGSGNPTVGNFLDDIQFGTPSCVVATKSVSPTGPVDVGQTLTYSVKLTNNGGSSTSNLVVNDVLPSGVTYVAGSGGANSSYNSGTRTLSVRVVGVAGTPGVLEAGQSTQVSFQVVVDDAAAGTLVQNTGSVTETDGTGAISTISTNTVENPVNDAADLSIEKSFTNPVIGGLYPGSTDLTLTVHNLGPNTAENIVVDDPWPWQSLSIGSYGGCTHPANPTYVLNCSLASLAPGQSHTFTITGITAVNTTNDQVIPNTATVSAATLDPDPSNNTSTAVLTVKPTIPSLSIVKTAQGSTEPVAISAGQAVSYEIVLTNTGTTALTNVGFTDTIPGHVALTLPMQTLSGAPVSCSASSSLLTCTGLPNLSATGDSEAVVVEMTTLPSMQPSDCGQSGTIASPWTCTDTATGSAESGGVPVGNPTSQATITVSNDPELEISKTVTNTPVAGGLINYEVTFTSLGPSTAHQAQVTDTLQEGLTFDLVPSNCTTSGQTMTCSLGDVAPDAPVTIAYTAQVPPIGGTFTNDVVASALNSNSVSTSATVTVQAAADLDVTKSVSPAKAPIGGVVKYFLTVTNNGPGTAGGVVVNDNAGEVGLSIISTSATPGSYDNASSTWTVGTLLSGQTASVTVSAKVMRSGLIANTIVATASDPSGTPPSKSATAYVNNPLFAVTGLELAPMVGSALLLMITGVAALVVVVLLRRRNA
jgi:uncharacterized repeat protein (TIGR01451 family)